MGVTEAWVASTFSLIDFDPLEWRAAASVRLATARTFQLTQ